MTSLNAEAQVSARTQPLRSVDRLRQAVKDGARFAAPLALLNHLLRDQGDVLVRIVRDAGDLVMSVYRSGFDVRQKDDASPVTEADERAEALIAEMSLVSIARSWVLLRPASWLSHIAAKSPVSRAAICVTDRPLSCGVVSAETWSVVSATI